MEEQRRYAAIEIMVWDIDPSTHKPEVWYTEWDSKDEKEYALYSVTKTLAPIDPVWLPDETYDQLVMLEEKVYGKERSVQIRWEGELVHAYIYWSERESGDTELAARFNLVVKVHKEHA